MQTLIHNIQPGRTGTANAAGPLGRPMPIDSRSVSHTGPSQQSNAGAGLLPGAIAYAREVTALATELAANGAIDPQLTANDLACLGLERLKELKAAASGAQRTVADMFAGYNINDLLDKK